MKKQSGYTLIELSIVLIIIGLIVSGILWATGLLRNAQMRTTISDFDHFQHALRQFNDKYNEMPGDMKDAENFWGSDASCPDTPSNTTPKTATCGGNGDGKISPHDYDGDGGASVGDFLESFRAWQQLNDAGMLNMAMTGAPGPGGTSDAQIGLNVPQGYAAGVGYMLYYLQCYSCAGGSYYPARYGHVIEAGMRGSAANDYMRNPFLTAQEAQNIDSKIDDGKPGFGKVLAPASEASCSSNASTYTVVSGNAPACALIYITGL